MGLADAKWLGDGSIVTAGKDLVLTKHDGAWWRMRIVQGSSPVNTKDLGDVTVIHEVTQTNPLDDMEDGTVIFFDGTTAAELDCGNWYLPGVEDPVTSDQMILTVISDPDSIQVLN